jgi:hypothetical protein
VLLLVLLGAEAPPASVRDASVPIRERAVESSPAPEGFWFDPGYAAFLEAVRGSTPERATIALFSPRTTDLYVYRAVYGLVPRRILPGEEWESAQYVAVYGNAPPAPIPAGTAVPGGTLLKR